jgi:hypothetical protein
VAYPIRRPQVGPKTLHRARRSAESRIFPALGHSALRHLTARHLDELCRRRPPVTPEPGP